MDQKEFFLKWNSYLDVFHGSFLSLLNSEHFTDVTLSCDSQSINCHRLILSSCSSYFETLLLGISHPHPIIILKDVKYHDLLALVKFMYTGEVTVSQSQTSSLIQVAEMLKVKGLANPDETVNQIQKPRYCSQNTLMTQPAVKRNRVDTTSENNFLAEDSSSNLEPPVADPSNDKLVNYPAETSFSVYKSDIAACNSLHVKEEFAAVSDKGGYTSSSQFEDDGDHFDFGSEKVIGNQILERTERKPNASLNFSEVEETFSDYSEDFFGRKYPILSPKHEDVSLVVSPGVSEQLNRNFKPYELESDIRGDERVADTSSSNTNALTEASNSNIGLLRKKYRKDYQCSICDKRFPFHSALEKHQRIHTRKKPFKCDLCKKCFTQSSSLNLHQRVHTGEKPFKCNVCQKSFSQLINLNRHQILHTGEKPYKCDVCEREFSDVSSLKRHISTHFRKNHATL